MKVKKGSVIRFIKYTEISHCLQVFFRGGICTLEPLDAPRDAIFSEVQWENCFFLFLDLFFTIF